MTHFLVRQQIGNVTLARAGELAHPQEPPGTLLNAYWTPELGQLLSAYKTDGSAPPSSPGAGPDIFPVTPITAEEYGPPGMQPAAGDALELPLVLVRRRLDPSIENEFRAVALRAILCAHEYTDLRWLRSYWARERNELHCVFRTRTHDLVREHAQRSRIPCDEVHDAVLVGPDAGPIQRSESAARPEAEDPANAARAHAGGA